ncbi:hypothetical protein Bpfe_007848 [Biomphalaria pfeifferi]|uniref:Uncharacterized protein n=1 Tax=Biomphalaria pfeifferi TaxID=112525 RepID=A0AAD8FG56_BIOPF|nr:hypothetical protein Bpfe_007848 [Biomphalaria pfeifferi]
MKLWPLNYQVRKLEKNCHPLFTSKNTAILVRERWKQRGGGREVLTARRENLLMDGGPVITESLSVWDVMDSDDRNKVKYAEKWSERPRN